jgi:hypothetical protein
MRHAMMARFVVTTLASVAGVVHTAGWPAAACTRPSLVLLHRPARLEYSGDLAHIHSVTV